MKNKRFIPGIYNYCDYWCERCAFTKRCRNFATGDELERKVHGKKPPDDAANRDFWNHLAHQLSEEAAFGPASKWAEELADVDLTPDPEWEEKQAKRDKQVESHPLVSQAYTYMKKTGAWLEAADADLKAFAQELLKAAHSKFANEDYEEQARQIGEMIEVVSWYHTLMPPKLARAVGWLVDEDELENDPSEILNESRLDDANGSGKVVLMAIERSAAAWMGLRRVVPRRDDEIIEMLALLSRMKRGIHEVLPGAKDFVRPGFDEPAAG